SIIENGLAGINPMDQWRVLDLAKQVFELSLSHLDDYVPFINRRFTFEFMVNQNSSGMNWQHGETYLSSSIYKATSYATSNWMGSELLTNTADFLRELIKRNVPEAVNKLYREFPEVYELLESSPSALLIEIPGLCSKDLKSEKGGDALEDLEFVLNNQEIEDEDLLFKNFRLTKGIECENLKIYMINVTQWLPGPFGARRKCDFYRITPERDFSLKLNHA
ncbi:MAG TPA: hypothetical protein VK941_10920, partial [Gillisia sp.]|nr:hypothetical protein [Gillisia sp.]